MQGKCLVHCTICPAHYFTFMLTFNVTITPLGKTRAALFMNTAMKP